MDTRTAPLALSVSAVLDRQRRRPLVSQVFVRRRRRTRGTRAVCQVPRDAPRFGQCCPIPVSGHSPRLTHLAYPWLVSLVLVPPSRADRIPVRIPARGCFDGYAMAIIHYDRHKAAPYLHGSMSNSNLASKYFLPLQHRPTYIGEVEFNRYLLHCPTAHD